jgi:hypothetical protein
MTESEGNFAGGRLSGILSAKAAAISEIEKYFSGHENNEAE